jgi:diguanylate cyclase (GGDEF)-like protein/PAS domain S-box-containing protein
MLVWVLIVVAIIASLALIGLGYNLVTDLSAERDQVHQELINKQAKVENLQTLLAEIRSESLKLFYEQDQSNHHNETVHLYSSLLVSFIGQFDQDENEPLLRCQRALEDLNLFTDRADQWASLYRQVHQRYVQGTEIMAVRRLLERLHTTADMLQGQQRLKEAVLIRRWRNIPNRSAEEIATQILETRGERWFPLLREVKAEVDSLARQVEMLASATRHDQLDDIRDNMLKPGLERLERNLHILSEEGVLPTSESSHLLEQIKVQLFGDEYRINQTYQTVLVSGGLYRLYEEHLELQQQRITLEQSLQHSYIGLENLNVALAQLTQERLDQLGRQTEQWLAAAMLKIQHGAFWMLLLFVVLGGVISVLVKRQVRQLALLQRHKELILNAAGDGIVGVNEKGRATFVNPAAARMLGFEINELLDSCVVECVPVVDAGGEVMAEQDHPVCQTFRLDAGESARSDLDCFRRRDGSTFSVEYVATPLIGPGGEHEGAVLVFKDLTRQQLAEKRLQEKKDLLNHVSNHDSLTGLPNRRLFKDRLYHAIERAKRNSSKMSVLFIDLDRFKKINDSLGHEVGDKLLMAVARRLQGHLRRSDTLARLGGDEFVIILEETARAHLAAVQARNLIHALSEVFEIDSHRLFVTASVGISRFPHDAQDVTGLMTSADAAMYYAKSHGRNSFQFYTPEMNGRAQEFLELETQLRDAMKKDQFELYYQPQYDMRTRTPTGVEVLLRWNHPELGVVSPADFIPLAEETGLIVPLGEWVLNQACCQNRQWEDEGLIPLRVAVNISTVQFHSDLSATVERVLEESGMLPELLELEITESMLMEDDRKTIDLLQELKRKGVHLSIDDFGTGYSSLNYLRRLPVEKLKIDRSFISEVVNSESDAAIAGSIIALGQNMNLQIVAEGVEDQDQEAFLLERKCVIGQGYHYAAPMKAEAFRALLQPRE